MSKTNANIAFYTFLSVLWVGSLEWSDAARRWARVPVSWGGAKDKIIFSVLV